MDDMQKLIERYKKELMDMSKSAVQTQTHTEKRRMPQIIGYADDKTEFDRLFDTFAEKSVSQEDEKTDTFEEIEEPVWEEKIPDEDEFTADDRQESDMNGLSEEQIPFSADDTAAKDGYPEKFEEETDGDLQFSQPGFTQIPSFEQTREDITNESVPENNEPAPDASGVTDNSTNAARPDFAVGGTVSEERIEGLNRQPVSGTEFGEQLTGRSFPDESTPENSRSDIIREGSQTEPGNFPEPTYTDYDDFLQKNTGEGTISFRVYTAREALPVEGAKVTVTKDFGGDKYTFFEMMTDSSGQTELQSLAAPDKSLSLDSSNKIQPFSLYDAVVSKNGYIEIILTGIPVFDGAKSVQRVAMVPSTENLSDNSTEVNENAK